MMNENRLLRLKIDDINAQRKAAGLPFVSGAQPYSSPTYSNVDGRSGASNASYIPSQGVETAPGVFTPTRPNVGALTDPTGTAAARLNDTSAYLKSIGSNNASAPVAPTAPASTGGFATLADAQKAQDAYYTKNGSNDPEIDAAIHNLQQYGGPTPQTTSSPTPVLQQAIDGATKAAGMSTQYSNATSRILNLKQQIAAMGDTYKFAPSDGALTTEQKQAKLDAYNSQKAALQAQLALAENKSLQQQTQNAPPPTTPAAQTTAMIGDKTQGGTSTLNAVEIHHFSAYRVISTAA